MAPFCVTCGESVNKRGECSAEGVWPGFHERLLLEQARRERIHWVNVPIGVLF